MNSDNRARYSACQFAIQLVEPLGDRAGLAGGDAAVVDLDDGQNLRGRAGQEDFVGGEEFVQSDAALFHEHAVLAREGDHFLAGDAAQEARAERRRGDRAGGDDENVRGGAFVITGKTYQLLQMGCPIIIGRNLESGIFVDKKDALIVEQSNPSELAKVILWAKNHPTELDEIGKNGKKLYQNKLSNRQLTEQLRLLLLNEHIL